MVTMYQDWIKIHRKIVRSAVFADPELLKLWVLCLVKANWKDCIVFWEGLKTPIHLERGQFVTGQQSLYADYYAGGRVKRKSSRTVWRWLQTLRELGNLDIQSVKAYSVVTIVNYNTYQDVPSDLVKDDVTGVSQACHRRVKPMVLGVSTEEESLRSAKNNQEPEEGKDKGYTIQDLADIWAKTDGTKPIRQITPDRRAAFATRSKDAKWDWRAALAKFPLKCFLDGDWTPDFDWLLRPKTVNAILEGKYDWSKDNGKPKSDQSQRTLDGAAEWLQQQVDSGNITD